MKKASLRCQRYILIPTCIGWTKQWMAYYILREATHKFRGVDILRRRTLCRYMPLILKVCALPIAAMPKVWTALQSLWGMEHVT